MSALNSDVSLNGGSQDKEDKWLQNQMSMFEDYPPPPRFDLPPPPLHPDMMTSGGSSSCDDDSKLSLQRQLDTCDINFVSEVFW